MGRPPRESIVRVWFNRDDKTCNTPAAGNLVILPTVQRSAFTGVGTTTGNTGFNLELVNCSPTISEIEYKLTPAPPHTPGHDPTVLETLTWATAYPDGTLPPGSFSTATGVGVQVLDGSGNPVVFDRITRLAAPNYSAGDPTATIPLQAQYIQTGAVGHCGYGLCCDDGTVYVQVSGARSLVLDGSGSGRLGSLCMERTFMSTVTFDTLECVRTLEAAGMPVQQAEALSVVVRKAQDSADVATKGEVRELGAELATRIDKLDAKVDKLDTKVDLLKWMLGFVFAAVISLLIKSFF